VFVLCLLKDRERESEQEWEAKERLWRGKERKAKNGRGQQLRKRGNNKKEAKERLVQIRLKNDRKPFGEI
jgi:hypothetical protein